VYCIQVPNHIFYVRRNGKTCWTGNSSRHGQKGVCSLILRHEDMPFTQDGIVPDVIMNPHCKPSRMTIGNIIEILQGLLCAAKGKIGDGTMFAHLEQQYEDIVQDYNLLSQSQSKSKSQSENNDSKTQKKTDPKFSMLAERIGDMLHDCGFSRYGNHRMYNGMTGEILEATIFMGPVFTMRLKHMTIDKKHARCTGPKQITTRQPVEGRSREGGLRFGEMERDTLVSHGAAAVLQDRLLDASDKYKTVVCTKCGSFAVPAHRKKKISARLLGKDLVPYCLRCKKHEHIKNVVIPYAWLVLMRDLECFHISMALQVKKP
jgi:DNA-directed RNA polymerase beta subunit